MRQSRLNLLVALFHTPRKYRDVPGQPLDEVGANVLPPYSEADVEAQMNAERVIEAMRTRERIEQATKKGKT